MSCPYFKEATFGICVAPDAIHVPSILEMEKFCFRMSHENCPNFKDKKYLRDPKELLHCRNEFHTHRTAHEDH
jgi:hypothetical protein